VGILRTEGFFTLVEAVAREGAGHATVTTAARHAASLGARLPAEIGLAALTRPEERLLAAADEAGAFLGAARDDEDRLALTPTGRLRVISAEREVPEGVHPIGMIDWPAGRPDGLAAELADLAAVELAEAEAVTSWLACLPRGRVDAMIAQVRFCLLHMAPVLLYTGDGCYTNLGKQSNLVGKSVAADSPRCLLNRLAGTPVTEWLAQDANFLACLYTLITSGPPVRAEEFSGTQLRPDRLLQFLRNRIVTYQAAVPVTAGLPVGQQLQVLAQATAVARVAVIQAGSRPYRVIQGLNLNKQEHLSREPVTLADVPTAVLETFVVRVGCSVPGDFAALSVACADAMLELHVPDGDGFSSRFERVLHELVEVATEVSGSDVGMSRGPRQIGELIRLVRQDSTAPVAWTTSAFYCCVTPSRQFARHFAQVPDELPQVLRAIAARMRYNGWHYLPHTIGVHERANNRDWFFAPTMSDLTDWSDQHHTGHVANGVRYAIRVPFGVTVEGAHRPGMHDFRLMRSAGQPYTLQDLRAAQAVGELLRHLYQAHADRLAGTDVADILDIVDFDNPWYQARYGRVSPLQRKEETHV
jgi:hypothetical protein